MEELGMAFLFVILALVAAWAGYMIRDANNVDSVEFTVHVTAGMDMYPLRIPDKHYLACSWMVHDPPFGSKSYETYQLSGELGFIRISPIPSNNAILTCRCKLIY